MGVLGGRGVIKRVVFYGAILALWAGNAGASLISCSLNGGGAPPSGCYLAASSFSPNDMLDWGAALGEALSPVTSTGAQNPGSSWNLTSTGGEGVNVSLGPGAISTNVTEVDNAGLAWDKTSWQIAQLVSLQEYGQAVLTFNGHFTPPPNPGPPGAYNLPDVQFGDHLIATSDGQGTVTGGGPMVLSFSTPLSAIGFRISVNGSSDAVDFSALVTAYDSTNTPIGTYSILDRGDGGSCSGLDTPAQTACNNAPWIGFVGSSANIASIKVEAFNLGGTVDIPQLGIADMPYLIDSLELNTDASNTGPTPSPEPGVAATMVLGLAALAWLGKARRARSLP